MKNRSRTDIFATILECANEGANKTKIMYKAFLSYTQLREYLSMLQENGMLEYEKDSETYRTTKKGRNFLHACTELGSMVFPDANRPSNKKYT